MRSTSSKSIRLRFSIPAGKYIRKQVEFFAPTKSQAKIISLHVNSLISALKTGVPPDAGTQAWIAALKPGRMTDALQRWGLLQPCEATHTVAELTDLRLNRPNITPATKTALTTHFAPLLSRFGNTDPSTITAKDAQDFIIDQLRSLKPATVAVRLKSYKAAFSTGVKQGWFSVNPFSDIKVTNTNSVDLESATFISETDTLTVIASCKNIETAIAIAAMRFAGFRGKSEFEGLTWGDITWSAPSASGYITIHATKTARFSGHDSRRVPLHPKFEGILKENKTGRKKTDPVLSALTCRMAYRYIAKEFVKSNIELDRPYSLRRSFCSDVLSAVNDPKLYEAISGHSFAIGQKYYQILHPDRVAKGSAKLQKSWEK